MPTPLPAGWVGAGCADAMVAGTTTRAKAAAATTMKRRKGSPVGSRRMGKASGGFNVTGQGENRVRSPRRHTRARETVAGKATVSSADRVGDGAGVGADDRPIRDVDVDGGVPLDGVDARAADVAVCPGTPL